MPINDHPAPGTILVCDFNGTFKEPEMVKPGVYGLGKPTGIDYCSQPNQPQS
jgi:hypothetical protein